MGLVPFRRAGVPPGEKSSLPSCAGGCGGPINSTSNRSGGRWRLRHSVLLGFLGTLFLLVAACSGRQSTWEPAGPVAAKQLELFNVLLWVMVVVFVLVEGALVYAAIRFRRRPGQERPQQVHGNLPLEITWTIIPTVLIMALGIWTVFALFDLEDPPGPPEDVLEVTVTGHQWWWEFEYPDAGGGKRITTANELRIPVDRPVRLSLNSDDVIHSFWVPKLAGKVDVIPTHVNEMWFLADSQEIDILPATFYGQCAEFCGIAHALMRFRVVVLEEADYQAWVRDYGPPPEVTESAQRGKALFAANCSTCHTISGGDDRAPQASRFKGFLTGGAVVTGPNLTDLRTRQSLAAGVMEPDDSVSPPITQEVNLRRWLRDPEDVKPGNYMAARAPIYQVNELRLSDEAIEALIDYLLNLQR